MIIGDDKKRALTSILSSKPDGSTGPSPMDSEDPKAVLHSIAEELIEAISSKDAASVAEALRALMAEIAAEDEIQDAQE